MLLILTFSYPSLFYDIINFEKRIDYERKFSKYTLKRKTFSDY